MSCVVDGSLEALIVAHQDTRHPHVHVIANRVDPETGKAAKLDNMDNSELRLSRWAERYDRESSTLLDRLRIWRTERSLRELVGAVWGRGDLVESWREDLDRYHKDERTALGNAHADSARQIKRKVREAYQQGLRDAERSARESRERGPTWEREHGPTITPIPIRPPRPRGPERSGGGFER